MTRRELLAAPLAAAPALAWAASSGIRLGAPIFLKSNDPAELAKEHRRLGYRAAYCPSATIKDRAAVEAIEKAFRAEDVVIAEVGAWKNMLDPDDAKRRENMAYIEERLALAEAVGARCCVDIAGSYNPKVWYGPHKDNMSNRAYDGIVENVRKLIDAVKPARTKFALEIMGWMPPDSADSYLRLIEAIDRPAFAVHFDLCNAVNSPAKFYGNADLSRELFSKLGRWVVSCHAKDLAWLPEMNLHFVEVIPGRGDMDYTAYLQSLQKYAREAPLMIEHLKTAEEYKEAADYIRGAAVKSSVPMLT